MPKAVREHEEKTEVEAAGDNQEIQEAETTDSGGNPVVASDITNSSIQQGLVITATEATENAPDEVMRSVMSYRWLCARLHHLHC